MINAIGIPLLHHDIIDEHNDALLKAAYLYRVPAYIYDITDVMHYKDDEKIRALFWDGGEYRACYVDLPKYTEVYCSIFEFKSKHPDAFALLSELTVFTDDIGLFKYDLQRKLLVSNLWKYAIPTVLIHSYEEMIRSVPMFPVSFLKPYGGRRAKGAMKLERRDNKLYYSTPLGAGELTKEAFTAYYADADHDGHLLLLMEPCLNILDDEGHAVDFRCLVSLNGEGKWQNVSTYARIGSNSVASNISRGGSYSFAEHVLESMLPGCGTDKLKEINRVALQVAEFVQKESPNPVSWLGIDICVDRPSNQIFVIEANSKPGVKAVGPWPLSLVRAQYFKYLLSKTEKNE